MKLEKLLAMLSPLAPNFVLYAPIAKKPPDMQSADQYRVLASIGRDLSAFCASSGIALGPIAAPLGIDVEVFDDFEARIEFDRLCRLLEALAVVSGDDTFGLRYGLMFTPGGSGVFGLGLASAPTFRDMLRFFGEFANVVVETDVLNIIVERERFTVEWTYSPLLVHREQFVDFAATSFLRLFEGVAGQPLRPFDAVFERRAPRDASLHKQRFGNKLGFLGPINRLVFSSDILSSSNASANPASFEFAKQKCEELRSKALRKKTIATIVKEDFLRNLKEGDCGLSAVARRAGMSQRTLQRRLASADVNFKALYDQTRDEMSMELLLGSDMPLAEVSVLLGYSSQSAYTRAVKRLHGVSPGKIRAQGQSKY